MQKIHSSPITNPIHTIPTYATRILTFKCQTNRKFGRKLNELKKLASDDTLNNSAHKHSFILWAQGHLTHHYPSHISKRTGKSTGNISYYIFIHLTSNDYSKSVSKPDIKKIQPSRFVPTNFKQFIQSRKPRWTQQKGLNSSRYNLQQSHNL